MSEKVKTYLSIVAIIAMYVVVIPFQTYRMGYNKGRDAGAAEWGSYGYSLAMDTVTSILDKEIVDGPDSTVTELQLVRYTDTLVYVISYNGLSSNLSDSITNKIYFVNK
jgi:hypothetical protein